MKHNGLYSQIYRAELDNNTGEFVEGFLTILSTPFSHVLPGHYISNKGGAPFAYRVKRETVHEK